MYKAHTTLCAVAFGKLHLRASVHNRHKVPFV